MENADILEWSYTLFNSLCAVLIGYAIYDRQKRARALARAQGMGEAEVVITIQKFLLYALLLLIVSILAILGVAVLITPPPIRASNEFVGNIFAIGLTVIPLAIMAFILLDLYLTRRLDVAVAKASVISAEWDGIERRATGETVTSVESVSRELMEANMALAAAEATLAQIDVAEQRAAVLAAATDVHSTSRTDTVLNSPATEDANVIAGVDAVLSGPDK